MIIIKSQIMFRLLSPDQPQLDVRRMRVQTKQTAVDFVLFNNFEIFVLLFDSVDFQ